MYSYNLEGLVIKIATSSDTPRIINMLKGLAIWMRDNEINQWGFLLEGGDDEEIEQAISDQETYIILRDDELIATFTLLSQQSEWDKHIWGDDLTSNTYYLHRLAIIPSYMNKGVGSSILTWIQNNLSYTKDYLKLDCVANNKKLNAFYINNNFEFINLHDGHNKYQKSLRPCVRNN